MKNTAAFIIFILLIVGLLYFSSGKEYSRIPGDERHREARDIAACTECHGKDMKNALKEKHPPKYECFKCHKR